ncbi:MAG TPA: exosortase/archaeosortase family protein [Opitutus sp.]|nr:exosortase/archaeosortase family protein [Opitutus sp.]
MSRTAREGGAATTAGGRAWRALALGAIWAPLLWKISPAWSASVEQAHGWAVPWLAAYFWWQREKESGWAKPGGTKPGAVVAFALASAAALALVLTVLEANPLWPAAQWAGYGVAATVTLAMLAFEGGRRAARALAFPIFFASTALTWPAALSERLQALLTGMNTQLAAAAVSAAGHPAVVSGNVIEVARGFVGVDEACSGMRALAAVWMAGWFFGELLRLTVRRRAALVAGSLAAAVAGNLARTTALTWLAATGGPAKAAKWHDFAGDAEMILGLAAVALLAWGLGRGRAAGRMEPGRDAARGPRARWLHGAVIAAGLLAAVAPTMWYRWHETHAPVRRVQWELHRPDASWRTIDLPSETKDLLRASAYEAFEHRATAAGGRTMALLVRWDGDVAGAYFAERHGPTVCLPASGRNVQVSAQPERVTVDGVPIAFEVGRFEADGSVQHVLFCQWDAWLARSRTSAGAAAADIAGWRLARVREGRRRGDAAFLVFLVADSNEAAARAWLAEWVPRLLRRR